MLSLNKNWNSLIKPSKVVYDKIGDTGNVVKVTVEPLERGFGLTLGNALRRILLSSLQGAAITYIKIPGILHEFSSIPGVKEDLVDICLNIKSIPIKMHTEKKTVRLNVTGPCLVKAGMIESNSEVEVLNPELVICTLDKGVTLEMELICEIGRGYVPATSAREKDLPIGVIAIDALFNPVKNVDYNVVNTRVGQVTDYDKLVMTVETNGTVSAEIAIGVGAYILQKQFEVFKNFEEKEDEKPEELKELPFPIILTKKVDELDFSVRAYNCIRGINIVYLGDLVIKTEAEMLKTQNFGRKSLNEIKEILATYNLRFGMEVPNWPPENLETLSKRYEESY